MLKHVVLLKVKEDVPDKRINSLFSGIVDLKKAIPGIMGLTYGAHADLPDQEFTHAFSMDFIDQEYLNDFRQHPLYANIRDNLNKMVANDGYIEFNYSLENY